METLLQALANQLHVYGATYKVTRAGIRQRGALTLGKVSIEVEINERRVARIEGRRFLHGSRRGYDHSDMIRHILIQLPALQERARLNEEWQSRRKTLAEAREACHKYTEMVSDPRIEVRFDEYAKEGAQFTLCFKVGEMTTAMVAADMVREIEEWQQPKLLNQSAPKGPMRWSFADDNGDPTGDEISLRGLAHLDGSVDLDRAVVMVIGEVITLEEIGLRIIRIS